MMSDLLGALLFLLMGAFVFVLLIAFCAWLWSEAEHPGKFWSDLQDRTMMNWMRLDSPVFYVVVAVVVVVVYFTVFA